MSRKNQGLNGYTLIEVLVSVGVLAVVLAGVVGVISATTQLLVATTQQVESIAAVGGHMDYIASLSYDDIGYVDASGSEPLGVLERLTAEGLETVVEVMDPDNTPTDPSDDFKKVTVSLTLVNARGHERIVDFRLIRGPDATPHECGTCPPGMSCSLSLGQCAASSGGGTIARASDCLPGLFCPDGTVCPVSGTCPGGATPLPEPSGETCVSGGFCSTGATCPLTQTCPTETCATGSCSGNQACFNGWCYDRDTYLASFPTTDAQGPGAFNPTECAEDLCETSLDCPGSCGGAGHGVVWQCERTWVPRCQYAGHGGAVDSDSCQPVPCPGTSQEVGTCANGMHCAYSSSNSGCSSDDDCPAGEMCGGGLCRTICGDSVACSPYWGGVAKGCKAYPIPGGGGSACIASTALVPITVTLTADGGGPVGENVEVLEGDSGFTRLNFTATISQNPIDVVQVVPTVGGVDPSDVVVSAPFIEFTNGGSLTQDLTIDIVGDTVPEAHEEFTFGFVGARSLVHDVELIAPDTVTVKIFNDDFQFFLGVTGTNAADTAPSEEHEYVFQLEGESSAGTEILGTTVTGVLGTFSMTGSLDGSDNVATAGVDYLVTNESFTFDPSEDFLRDDEVFAVPVIEDTLDELAEYHCAAFTSITASQGTVTVSLEDSVGIAWIDESGTLDPSPTNLPPAACVIP